MSKRRSPERASRSREDDDSGVASTNSTVVELDEKNRMEWVSRGVSRSEQEAWSRAVQRAAHLVKTACENTIGFQVFFEREPRKPYVLTNPNNDIVVMFSHVEKVYKHDRWVDDAALLLQTDKPRPGDLYLDLICAARGFGGRAFDRVVEVEAARRGWRRVVLSSLPSVLQFYLNKSFRFDDPTASADTRSAQQSEALERLTDAAKQRLTSDRWGRDENVMDHLGKPQHRPTREVLAEGAKLGLLAYKKPEKGDDAAQMPDRKLCPKLVDRMARDGVLKGDEAIIRDIEEQLEQLGLSESEEEDDVASETSTTWGGRGRSSLSSLWGGGGIGPWWGGSDAGSDTGSDAASSSRSASPFSTTQKKGSRDAWEGLLKGLRDASKKSSKPDSLVDPALHCVSDGVYMSRIPRTQGGKRSRGR